MCSKRGYKDTSGHLLSRGHIILQTRLTWVRNSHLPLEDMMIFGTSPISHQSFLSSPIYLSPISQGDRLKSRGKSLKKIPYTFFVFPFFRFSVFSFFRFFFYFSVFPFFHFSQTVNKQDIVVMLGAKRVDIYYQTLWYMEKNQPKVCKVNNIHFVKKNYTPLNQ